MKHLSLLTTLLLTSSMVYAGDWTYHNFNPDTKMYNPVPKYSCLEMICEYGCVEDKQGNGECCPAPVEGTNCASDTRNEKGCILSLKKTCPSNQYCNISTQTCQLIPSCNPCQKFDSDKGQCVADTSKNNQAVGTCGKCNNGSVITDTTKVTPCKTCNTTNWTLTNKSNGTLVDACRKCQNGAVDWINPAKQFISNNTCVECLTDSDCPDGHTCNDKKCQKSCVKNVDWGKSCTDDCQCKDGTGKYSGWSGICQNNVCCFNECTFCGSKPYCPSVKYEKKLPKSVSFSVHNGGDKHTSCKSKHKVYVYVEALSTNKGTFNGTLSLVETDTDDHRKYLRLNGQKFSKNKQYDYDVSLEPGEKELVATYSDTDNFAQRASRGKITIEKANLSGTFSGGTGEVKVQIMHSPSCSLSWVKDDEDGFGPNGGTYSY